MRRLNLGCGKDIREGWTNLDRAALPGVDVVHDLAQLPLPFEAQSFDVIEAKDVLEHLDYIPLLQELHRILVPGGELRISVPHFSSIYNYIDPTHLRRFSARTWEFFCKDQSPDREYYFPFAFAALEEVTITFPGYLRVLEKVFNRDRRWRHLYESTGLCRLFPATNLRVTLRR